MLDSRPPNVPSTSREGHSRLGGCRHARKEERVRRLRMQQSLQDEQEVTLSPRINPASRHMALSLARRAAQQDPHLLTVIQSQPEGWVLGNRPATARRPVTAPGMQAPCLVTVVIDDRHSRCKSGQRQRNGRLLHVMLYKWHPAWVQIRHR